MADPNTSPFDGMGMDAGQPSALPQPQQLTGSQVQQNWKQQQDAEASKNTWGNLQYRIYGTGSTWNQLTSAFSQPQFPYDPNFKAPKATDPIYEGLSEDQISNVIAGAGSEAELQHNITRAQQMNLRAQMMDSSNIGVKAMGMAADQIPYLPLMAVPGVGEEVGFGRVGGFIMSLTKDAALGTAEADFLSHNDPNRSGSELAWGAANMAVMGGLFKGAEFIRFGRGEGRFGVRIGEGPPKESGVAPTAPPEPSAPSGEPSGPEGAPTPPEPPQEAPNAPQGHAVPKDAGVEQASTQKDLIDIQNHLEKDKVLDGIDNGEISREQLGENAKAALDAQREVEQLHQDAEDTAAVHEQVKDQIEDAARDAAIEKMEQAGEIPPRQEPAAVLEAAYRETGEGRVPLTEVLAKVPEEQQPAVLKALEQHPAAELHEPPAPEPVAEGQKAPEPPETVAVGGKQVHEVSMDIPSKADAAADLKQMRESPAKDHQQLAKRARRPDLAAKERVASAEREAAKKRIDDETGWFSGKKQEVPPRLRDSEAINREELRQMDIDQHLLPEPEKGDDIAPVKDEEEPTLHPEAAQKVVDGVQAKIAATKEKFAKFPRRLAEKLEKLDIELEHAKAELAEAKRQAKKGDAFHKKAMNDAAWGDAEESLTHMLQDMVTNKDDRIVQQGADQASRLAPGAKDRAGMSPGERMQWALDAAKARGLRVAHDVGTQLEHDPAMYEAGEGLKPGEIGEVEQPAIYRKGPNGERTVITRGVMEKPLKDDEHASRALLEPLTDHEESAGRINEEFQPNITHKAGAYRAHDILDYILHLSEPGSPWQMLAARLRSRIENIRIDVAKGQLRDSKGRAVGGLYYNKSHRIELTEGASVQIALHEMVHAVTTRFIDQNPNHPMVRELEGLLKHVKDTLANRLIKGEAKAKALEKAGDHEGAAVLRQAMSENKFFYGLTNVHEMLAEAMTNKDFQTFLAHIPAAKAPELTTWDHFVNLVGKIVGAFKESLGITGVENSAFEHVVAAFEGLSRSQKYSEDAARAQRKPVKLTAKGRALEQTHAAMPTTQDDFQKPRGDWIAPWQKGGQFNALLTNTAILTDIKNLGIVAGGIGAKYISPVVGAARMVTNRLTAFGLKRTMQDAGAQQIARKDAYYKQWLAEPGHKKSWNPFDPRADEAFQRDVYEELEGRGTSPAAKKFVNEVVRPFYDGYVDRALETNAPWAKSLQKGTGYHPRVHDPVMQRALKDAFGGGQQGSDAMGKLWAQAFQRAGTAMGLSQSTIEAIGQGYQKRLEAIHGGYDYYVGHGVNVGDTAFMKNFMQQAGLAGPQLDRAVAELEAFHQRKLEGPADATHKRLDIDLTTPINAPGFQGKTIADLMDKRAVKNMSRYNETMSGAIGMARVGTFNEEMFKADIEKGLRDMDERRVDQWRRDSWEQQMLALWSHQLGLPLDSNKAMQGWQQLAHAFATLVGSAKLGMSGIPIAFTNVARTLNYTQFQHTMQRIPEFGAFMRDVTTGNFKGAGIQSLAQVFNVGLDAFSQKIFDHITDGPRTLGERFLQGFQTVANRSMQAAVGEAHVGPVRNIFGMAPAIKLGKMVSAVNMMQRITDNIYGRENAATNISEDLWHFLGIDKDTAAILKTDLQNAIPNIDKESFGAYTPINWGAMKNIDARDRLIQALQAFVSRQIHDEDWGARAPWMDTTLGKMMMQLRTFTFEASTKQLAAGVNIGGAEAASDAILMSVGGALEFVARTYMNAMTMDDEQREKYLAENRKWSRIVAAAYARNPQTTVLPGIVDTALNLVGHPGIAQGLRSSGQDQNFLTGNPTADALSNISSALSDGFKAMQGKGQITQRSLKNVQAITPLGNAMPGMLLFNHLGGQLPAKQLRQPRGQQNKTLLDEAFDE